MLCIATDISYVMCSYPPHAVIARSYSEEKQWVNYKQQLVMDSLLASSRPAVVSRAQSVSPSRRSSKGRKGLPSSANLSRSRTAMTIYRAATPNRLQTLNFLETLSKSSITHDSPFITKKTSVSNPPISRLVQKPRLKKISSQVSFANTTNDTSLEELENNEP